VGLNEAAQLGLPNMSPLGTDAPPNSVAAIDFGVDGKGVPICATLVGVGAFHNCALLNTREIRCWGMNSDGQLGLGYSSPRPYGFVGGSPDTVPGKLPAVQVFPPAH
jgi:alpha-tubulin suppressor-like RCC1 family protein